MKYIELNDTRIPALGYGTWQLTGEECRTGVSEAIEYGYRHIDTAQAYENEKEVGAGIEQSSVPRHEIFLTTKVWMTNVSKSNMDASIAESLGRLKTDYVDLLLIHWPVDDVPLEEQIEALVELKRSGKARNIGVSNFPVALMEKAYELSGGEIVNNQVEYHPFLSQEPVLDFVRLHDMFLTAYSPLARGETIDSDVLSEIAEKYDKDPTQVSLRWLLDQDRVAAIPKAAKTEHMKSNFDIFDFDLEENDRARIDELRQQQKRLINPSWAPRWDNAKKDAA